MEDQFWQAEHTDTHTYERTHLPNRIMRCVLIWQAQSTSQFNFSCRWCLGLRMVLLQQRVSGAEIHMRLFSSILHTESALGVDIYSLFHSYKYIRTLYHVETMRRSFLCWTFDYITYRSITDRLDQTTLPIITNNNQIIFSTIAIGNDNVHAGWSKLHICLIALSVLVKRQRC